MQLMRESVSAGNKFRLLVNFHSPSPENDSYVVPYNPTLLPASLRSEAEQLAGCVQRRFPKDFPLTADETSYQRVAPWWHDDIEQRPEGFVLNAFGAGSMALEIAYHASSTGTPTSPKKLLEIGACAARGLEDFLTGGSKVSIPLYGSLAPIFNQTDGWILWQIPWHTRISFQKTHAWAVGDDPQARVYFGGPDRYLPEHIPLRFSRRPGGEAVVKWLCYDEDGNRLLAASPLQELPVTKSPEQLQISCELPPLTARVRPGFLLNGSFRPFEIWA
jgi:hypothetical protein